MRAISVLKALVFYLVFSSLCVAIVLFTMRYLANRAGKPELYGEWRGEINDAFREARGFLSEYYAKAQKRRMK